MDNLGTPATKGAALAIPLRRNFSMGIAGRRGPPEAGAPCAKTLRASLGQIPHAAGSACGEIASDGVSVNYYVLDVSFGEDNYRPRKQNAAANFIVIRHFAVSLSRSFDGDKLSVPRRRGRCDDEVDYREQLLERTAVQELLATTLIPRSDAAECPEGVCTGDCPDVSAASRC